MPFTEPPPPPPAPDVVRVTQDGHPTPAQVDYERKLIAWLKRLASHLP